MSDLPHVLTFEGHRLAGMPADVRHRMCRYLSLTDAASNDELSAAAEVHAAKLEADVRRWRDPVFRRHAVLNGVLD